MFNFANAGAARKWQKARTTDGAKKDPEPSSTGAPVVGEAAQPVGGTPQPLVEANRPATLLPQPAQRPPSPKRPAALPASGPGGAAAAAPAAPARPALKQAWPTPSEPATPAPPASSTVQVNPSAARLAAFATPATPAAPAAPAAPTAPAAPELPQGHDARLQMMQREVLQFSPALGEQLLGTRKLVLRIGGARDLAPPAAIDGAAPAKLKPYVVVSAVDRTGRRMGGTGLEFESGLPKQHLTLMDSAPVWNEEIELEFDAATISQVGGVAVIVMDMGPRRWFGTKSADVHHAQGQLDWQTLTAANLETKEHTLSLTASGASASGAANAGATLTLRSFFVDMARFQQDVATIERAIAQAAGDKADAAAQRQRSELRLRRETEIMEAEMELDFRHQASVQASKMLNELREELVGFVRSEEQMCSSEEAQLTAEIKGAVTTLEGASDASMQYLNAERSFYADEAPVLHRQLHQRAEAEHQEFLAHAQRSNLGMVKQYNDAKLLLVEECQSRLHQATDYQRVLHREAVQRASRATEGWSGFQTALLREELEHAAQRFSTSQQALQAEHLASASVLHAALVQVELSQEEEAKAMRVRQEAALSTLTESAAETIEQLSALEAEAAEAHRQDEAVVHTETSARLRRLDERGVSRLAKLHANLQRVETFLADADEQLDGERIATDKLGELEAESRLELVKTNYERRLARLSVWVAATEEDGRRLQEAAEHEALATENDLQRRKDELRAMEDRERSNRMRLERARVDHVKQLQVTHAELSNMLAGQQADFDGQMRSLLFEREALEGTLMRAHIDTVQSNASDALQRASDLRRQLRNNQAEMAVVLLVMHQELQQQAAESRECRLQRGFADAVHAIKQSNLQASMTAQLQTQRARNADELACTRHGMLLAEKSWNMEKAELLAASERVSASRGRAAEAYKEQALQQTREHYGLIVEQQQRWLSEARTKASERAEALLETTQARQDQLDEAAAREMEAFRRVEHTADAIMERNTEWFGSRLRSAVADAGSREERERMAAAALVDQAMAELAAQREQGLREDARAHNTQLLQCEEQMHDEALAAAARTNETLQRLAGQHATLGEQLAAQGVQLAEAAAAKTSLLEEQRVKNVTAMLQEARATSDEVRDRTSARVKLLATHSTRALLQAEEVANTNVETAVARHTLLLERHTRQRQQHLLTEVDALRKRQTAAVAELRSRALEVLREEQRSQQAAEQRLRERLEQALQAAEPESKAQLERDRASMLALHKASLESDTALHEHAERAALAWHEWAQERFTSQLGTVWSRQLLHHAQMMYNTQQARQTAFEEQWQQRQDEVQRRADEHWLEQEQSAELLVGSYRNLQTEVVVMCKQMQVAAQNVLGGLANDMVESSQRDMSAFYEAAQAAGERATEGVKRLLEASAAKARALQDEISEGRRQLGPEPEDYVRETLQQALHSDAQQAAVAEVATLERDLLAAHEAATAKAVEELARARELRLTEEREAANSRRAALEKAERERDEAVAMRQVAMEERRLMSEGPAELDRAARAQAEQCDLEWDAREAGLAASGAARLEAAEVAHAQLMLAEVHRQRQIEERQLALERDPEAVAAAASAQLDARQAALRAVREAHRSFDVAVAAQQRKQAEHMRMTVAETRARNDADLVQEIPDILSSLRNQLSELSVAQLSSVITTMITNATGLRELPQYRAQKVAVNLVVQYLDEQADELKKAGAKEFAQIKALREKLSTVMAEVAARLEAEAEPPRPYSPPPPVAEPPAPAPVELSDVDVLAQLREGLRKNASRVSELFLQIDRDGSGSLSKAEFRRVRDIIGMNVPDAQLDALFDSWDPDGSGSLSLKELNRVIKRGGAAVAKRRVLGGGGSLISNDDSPEEALAKLRAALVQGAARVLDLFREWDTDKNGKITKQEFRRAMPLLGLQPKDIEISDRLFDSFDSDGGGHIELGELKRTLARAKG